LHGKESLFSVGEYPSVSLSAAERLAMMQQYADMLDALRAGATIIPFGRAA